MTDGEKYHRPAWMTDDQWFCALLVADLVGGFHNVNADFKPSGSGVRISLMGGRMSTFDFDRLTKLVLLAHDRCVRVEICNGGPNRDGLQLHRRHGRDGSNYAHHPTIEQAIATHRRYSPEPTT